MSTIPLKDRRARTGSTLRGNPLRAHRLARQEAADRPLHRLTREYHRACRQLIPAADLKRAAAIAHAVKLEWRQASLKAGGDGTRLEALKDAARRKFHREAARALPGYRKWLALTKGYRKVHLQLDRHALSGAAGPRLEVAWGEVPHAPPPGAVEFVPPFPLFDVQMLDPQGHVTADTSFAGPAAGNLVNNFVFDRDESTPAIIGAFGLTTRPDTATSLASCGGNFTLPRTGRLQVNANVRNYYNKAVLSLRDRFGFSYGKLGLQVRLFIDVIRGRDVIHLPTTMLATSLDSDGDDVSRTVTDIDNSMLFQVEGVTEETIAAGERVQVMVGSEVSIGSEQDDMDSHASAVYYWQVRKMFVAVI